MDHREHYQRMADAEAWQRRQDSDRRRFAREVDMARRERIRLSASRLRHEEIRRRLG